MVLRSKLSINKTEKQREGRRKEGLGRWMYREEEWPDIKRGGHNTSRRVGGQVELSLTKAIQAAAINLL